jgi:hypothetical protein
MFERNSTNANNANISKNACDSQDASNNSETSNNSTASMTSNIKDDSNIMTAQNSRNAIISRNESNNRTANTVWTPSKAGMLAKTVTSTTAWREANSSRDNRYLTASTAEGRPATARMSEIVETSQQQY